MIAFLTRLRDRIGGRGYRRDAQGGSVDDVAIADHALEALKFDAEEVAADPIGWSYRMIARQVEQTQDDLTEQCVVAALERLPPKQLAMLSAWLQRGMTCHQIAVSQGISKEDAVLRAAELLKTLRESLDADVTSADR